VENLNPLPVSWNLEIIFFKFRWKLFSQRMIYVNEGASLAQFIKKLIKIRPMIEKETLGRAQSAGYPTYFCTYRINNILKKDDFFASYSLYWKESNELSSYHKQMFVCSFVRIQFTWNSLIYIIEGPWPKLFEVEEHESVVSFSNFFCSDFFW
jgi:hypothetical protein